MEAFDESKNYKLIHLEWIKANRGFRPQRGIMPRFATYLDEMTEMYETGGIKQNKTAFIYLRDDYNWSKRSKTIKDEVAEMFGDKPENNNPRYFITFNWSPDSSNFDIPKILLGIERLYKKSWIDEAKGVFEYHGLHGNHPHFMCLIQVNKYKTPSKIKEKIFESSLASTLQKNFIDIKLGKAWHIDYVDLDKSDAKKECIEKDVIWRKENGLQEFYEK